MERYQTKGKVWSGIKTFWTILNSRHAIRDMWILHKINQFCLWCKLSNCKLRSKVVKANLLFSGFLVEHKPPLTAADHAAELFRNMFPDSKIVNKGTNPVTQSQHIC